MIAAQCHGFDCLVPHAFTEAEVAWLLERFSEDDWEDGPRCLRAILIAAAVGPK